MHFGVEMHDGRSVSSRVTPWGRWRKVNLPVLVRRGYEEDTHHLVAEFRSEILLEGFSVLSKVGFQQVEESVVVSCVGPGILDDEGSGGLIQMSAILCGAMKEGK